VNGNAVFSVNGNQLVVVNSNGTIIQWGSFSIGSNESVYFQQSSSSSSVLNRVLSGNPSEILGSLSSNGKVWLINPAGIMVGAGARIDVAGFVASTLNVSNENFLAGKLLFDATPGAASVVNKGTITTPSGGSVYLVGTGVTNEGLITTPKGETLLAAGQTVSLVDTGTPGVKVEVTGSEGEATNLGTILAEAGRIGLAGVLVRNSGTLNASSVVNEGGRIFLRASKDAYVDGNGRIVTTGMKGGQVEVLGENVTVTDNAVIDASGQSGGGSVLVGGDYHGQNAAIPNAKTAYFGSDSSIKADAVGNGDGGKIVLWSTDSTKAYGSLSARGGALGGNGGSIETSGHTLDVNGIRVDTRAVLGATGNWLLDPGSICIYTTTVCTADLAVSWSSLATSLATTTVSYATDGNSADSITITGGYSFNSSNALNFRSRGGISMMDVSIINSGSGAINLVAGWDGNASTPGAVAGNGSITIEGSTVKTGGSMTWLAGSGISIRGSANNAAYVSAGGNQTFTVTDGSYGYITLQGYYNGTNQSAWLESQSGTQTLSAHYINVYGGGTTPGGTYSGNYAKISANGTQLIQVMGDGGALRLEGGGSTNYGGYNNYARIEQNTTGGSQQITYTGDGGSLHVYGGNGGYSNQAEIDGGMGSLSIGDISHRPDIELRGGSSGGTLGYENGARIGLADVSAGTLTVYGQYLSIYGGSADHGGAGLGAKTQRIDLSQDLYMLGGSSTELDEDSIPANAVYIGSKYGADIRINTGGGVTLQGGSGSPVLIGSLTGTASVYIETAPSSGITIQSDSNGGAGVFLGSLAELVSSVDARSTALLSNDILMGSQTQLVSGGDALITSSYGKVGMGYLKVYAGAGYGATISANGSILDQNGTGINVEADSIDVHSTNGGQMDGLAISLDTKITSSNGGLTAVVGVPDSPYPPLSGGISIRNTDTVGFGTGSGYISLRDYSLSGGVGAGSDQLRVYFQNSADLALNKVNIGGGSSTGDLIIESGGNLSVGSGYWARDATNLTLRAAGTFSVGTEGMVENSSGNLSVQANNVVLSGAYLYASGQLSLTATQDVTVNNRSDIESAGAMTVNARNISVSGGSFFSVGVYDQTAVNANFNASGNISLTGGSYIEAGDDVRIQLSGQSSTLSLSDHSYVLSDAITQVPATTHVTFTNSTTGGIYLDGVLTSTTTTGQSGFYVLDTNTPALPGSGLDLIYANVTTTATNPVVPTIDKLTKDITTNTLLSSSSSLIPQTGVGTTSSSDSGHTVGGEPGTFGGSEKQDQGNEKEQNNAKPKQKNYCS
jgi:filamentous hemagglutinin family protein